MRVRVFKNRGIFVFRYKITTRTRPYVGSLLARKEYIARVALSH